MPKKEIDYSKLVIYKIVCNDLTITDLYIGSTTDFIKRKNSHKSRCNNINNAGHNFSIYKTIRENGNWGNWSMILIETFPCINGNEARARERYWYEQLQAKLNMKNPNRNDKEYYDDNKEKIKSKVKQWNNDNKEHRNEYMKEYIKEYNKRTYMCEKCNIEIKCCNKLRHETTKKHIQNL